jgi:hypothetical protein
MELKRIHLASIAVVLLSSIHWTKSQEICSNSSMIAKSRMKRYLIFQPGSRILVWSIQLRTQQLLSFILFYTKFRINVRDNIIKVNQIFAHGFGFRANIDLLQPMRPKHKVRRREVYETIEELINQQGRATTDSIGKDVSAWDS